MNLDLATFGQVIFIDLVLAGDNAVVIGALASRLDASQRNKAVAIGMVGAVVSRILLSLIATWLMLIPGMIVFGGILLLWVAAKMWADIRGAEAVQAHQEAPEGLGKAVFAIIVADVSMSLDNVLGVAGAAQGHIPALVFGLTLSILLMGVAASFIASVMNRHRWIAYIGLALILFVACRMIWHGSEVAYNALHLA